MIGIIGLVVIKIIKILQKGYEFKAHDALKDVKATLWCYKKMIRSEKHEV